MEGIGLIVQTEGSDARDKDVSICSECPCVGVQTLVNSKAKGRRHEPIAQPSVWQTLPKGVFKRSALLPTVK